MFVETATSVVTEAPELDVVVDDIVIGRVAASVVMSSAGEIKIELECELVLILTGSEVATASLSDTPSTGNVEVVGGIEREDDVDVGTISLPTSGVGNVMT